MILAKLDTFDSKISIVPGFATGSSYILGEVGLTGRGWHGGGAQVAVVGQYPAGQGACKRSGEDNDVET